MRKILLMLIAIMLFAGAAYAQPGPSFFHGWITPPLVIPGNPFQPFNPRNESYIKQQGWFSWAWVMQIGDQSKSFIYQDTRYGMDFAKVIQKSECCEVYCCWLGWIPHFTTSAYQNLSKIRQTGSGWHDAYVNQNGDGNKSFIRQSSRYAEADVRQTGGFNESIVEQYGCASNTADVDQIGDLNQSYILQAGYGVNYADVFQWGFGNVSAIYQNGCCGFNYADVNQYGYMNLSKISQTGFGVHRATVIQMNNCWNAYAIYCPPYTGGCYSGQ